MSETSISPTSIPYNRLRTTVIARFVGGLLVMGVLLFGPAGTLRYWQGWLYLAVLFLPMAVFAVYLLRVNPAALARRMKTRETAVEQRWIIALSSLLSLVIFLVPGVDQRYGWSRVPLWLVFTAALLILLGYGLFIWTVRTNEFAARTIEVEAQQPVITTGPYAFVRHPMYAAVMVIIVFSPLALGSYWALLPTMLFPRLIVARIVHEEELLRRELVGYEVYCDHVRYRLMPGLW